MSTLINLSDLLNHEIDDLYSAEEQIIEALPDIIEKASNQSLKKALEQHLSVTKTQLKRLDKARKLLGKQPKQSPEQKGFFARLFGEGPHKCKGTQGLIDEAKKIMNEELTPQVKDAAIIAAVQKIEHYEISGYGTAKAFAIEMKMTALAALLNETLDEEYAADDLLTRLAVFSGLNKKAENATEASLNGNAKHANKKPASKKPPVKKQTQKTAPKKATPVKKTNPANTTQKKAPASNKSNTNSTSTPKAGRKTNTTAK